jgi:Na+/proline symporter
MQLIDWIVLGAYLVGVTVLGMFMGKNIKTLADFLMPRKFGPGMMIMHAFGTGTASDQAVTVASASARSGLSGIWFQWLWLFSTPFYWLIAPIFRRFRALTTADVYELRYGSSVRSLYAVSGIASMVVKIATLLIGSGALIQSGTNGEINSNIAIPLVTLLFVVYGAAGGLGAAIVTDFIQGILTIIFSFMLLPFLLNAVGGMDGVRETINRPEMFSMAVPGKIDTFFVVMFSVSSLAGIVAQPFIMGVCAAGRTEYEGRIGFVVGNFIKRICTVAWTLTGLAAIAWYMQQGMDLKELFPDKASYDAVYGDIAQRFLPNAMPGLLGIFMAAMLAGVMSSCDSFMVSSAGLFAENIYRPIAGGKSEQHYMWSARVASIVIVLAAVVLAYALEGVVSGLKVYLKLGAVLGITFWLGLLWRRMNSVGVWSGTIAGFLVWWLTTQESVVSLLKPLPFRVTESDGLIRDPWQILLFGGATVVCSIVGSLVSRPPDPDRIRRFHELIRTPVTEGEVPQGPCMLPEGVAPAERRSLFPGTAFEIAAPSRVSVIGFIAAWIGVGLMILGFYWITQG